MDTDNEDSDNGVFRDPDIPKVKRGLPQIKENTELENHCSLAEKEWNKKVSEDYKIQKKSAGIEFVNVKKCKKLHPASKTYLTKFRQMRYKKLKDYQTIIITSSILKQNLKTK